MPGVMGPPPAMPSRRMHDEPTATSDRGGAHAAEAISRGPDPGKGTPAMTARQSARSAAYPGALPSRRRSRPRTRWRVHGDRQRRHSQSKCSSAPHACFPLTDYRLPDSSTVIIRSAAPRRPGVHRNQCVKITRIGQRPAGTVNMPAAGQARGGAGCVGCQVLPNQRRVRSDPKATLSAARSADGPSRSPTGLWPLRKVTSTLATMSCPSSM